MRIDALFVDKWAIMATTASMYSDTAAMNSATFHKTVPTRLLPQEHHATKTGIVPGHNTQTTKGTDQNPPTIDTDIEGISTDHNHTSIPTMTGAAAATEGTLHSPSSHCSGSCYAFANGCPNHHLHCDTPHRHCHTPS